MNRVLIAGHPNSGKTELFNALTNSHARVGNWSGVTVEGQSAPLCLPTSQFMIHDLPGLYALMDNPESEDEKLARLTITQSQPGLILNVINACQLERQLFLTSELLELGAPVVIVLSMMNLARSKGITINTQLLSERLACPVLVFEPEQTESIEHIKRALQCSELSPRLATPCKLAFSPELSQRIAQYQLEACAAGLPEARSFFEATQRLLQQAAYPDVDLELANARYTAIHELAVAVEQHPQTQTDRMTAAIDSVLLHRHVGVPLFLLIMYGMFFVSIHVGGIFQDFFDQASNTLFVQLPAQVLHTLHCPDWLVGLIADGLGKGMNTTLTFIPVLGAMYLCLTFLESSGYMARAAFVMDRLMRLLGLPGKAFVPLIIGFGCNVPAILATRTLENKRDRALTIFMSPFMSCSARLTIYTVFASAFFPESGQNLIFFLYLLGIVVAVGTGLILQKTLFPSQLAPLLLELPPYHLPRLKRIGRISGHRLQTFLVRAGRLILPVCFVLSLANLIPGPDFGEHTYPSLLAYLGQQLTPLFTPMGLEPENWPATVGLLTGILAKEVVIGSLNTLYQQIGHVHVAQSATSIANAFVMALQTIPDHLNHLWQSFLHPLTSKVQTQSLSAETNALMKQHFRNPASVYAYLTFILLYLPCVSTMAAIKQETSSKLMWFSIFWSFGVAYTLAIIVYQGATFSLHPLTSFNWIVGIALFLFAFFYILRYFPSRFGVQHAL